MVESIKETDSSILHPTAQIHDDPQGFIHDILTKDIIDNLVNQRENRQTSEDF